MNCKSICLFCAAVVALSVPAFASGGAEYDLSVADFPRLAGEKDDGARIQRAVDATEPGSVLYFPKGIYKTSRTIQVTNCASLLLHKSATIRATAKMEYLLVIANTARSAYNRPGVTFDQGLFLRGGHLDGNGLASGLYLNNYFHLTVRDVIFVNSAPYGCHVGRLGCELVADNLYFRTYLSGLAGNVGLFTEGCDGYFSRIIVVDHTVGVRTTGQSNAFFQCHVWGGLVPPVTKGRLPEMLENSICFDLGGMMNLLRDCYADTGATGFRVDGVLQQIVGCWFLNNTKFGLKDITVVRQTPSSSGLLVADCCFRGSGPETKLYEGPGTVKWRDMSYSGFGEKEPRPAEIKTLPTCDCASPDEWEFVSGIARFESRAGEFKVKGSCPSRSLELPVKGEAVLNKFPNVGPGKYLVVRIRATDVYTKEVEMSVSEKGRRVWGERLSIGPEWREIRLPIEKLRYFSHWGLPPIQKGERLDARKITSLRFMYGQFLAGDTVDKPHGFEVSSVRVTGW